jgi:hypothetical protein
VFSVTLLLLVLPTGDNAQLIKGYGIKVALTSSTQTFEYSNPPWTGFGPSPKRRIGFNAGVYVEWLALPIFSVLSEIEYVQKGFGEEFNITQNDPTVIATATEYRRIDYVSFPLLGKFILPLNSTNLYILAGPRADFLVAYDPNFSSIYKDFKKTMFGASFGIGLNLETFMPFPLSLEFRYNSDFSDSFDNGNLRVRNNSYDFWLGVTL